MAANHNFLKRSLKAAIVLAAAGFSMVSISQRVGAADPKPGATEKKVDFTKDIQPVFKESCVRCHKAPEARGGQGGGPGGGPGRGGPRGPAGGFRLDDKDEALKGGKHGAA